MRLKKLRGHLYTSLISIAVAIAVSLGVSNVCLKNNYMQLQDECNHIQDDIYYLTLTEKEQMFYLLRPIVGAMYNPIDDPDLQYVAMTDDGQRIRASIMNNINNVWLYIEDHGSRLNMFKVVFNLDYKERSAVYMGLA